MDIMHLLTPEQVQLPQAVHLFITTQGMATIEGTAPGDDDQTPQARPTQAVWVSAIADTDIAVTPTRSGQLSTIPWTAWRTTPR